MRTELTRDPRALVARSVDAYRKVHRDYEARHGEIFNPIEQSRLRAALAAAVRDVSGPPALRALDLGCGTGNVTAHLVDLGLAVLAADVSPEFLAVVARRFADSPVETLALDGLGLGAIPDASLDLVAAYSVLHHVPDYLAMVREACRVLRPGGVLYLDHEVNDAFWAGTGGLAEFRSALDAHRYPGWWNPARKRWQRYLMPSKYVWAVRQRIDPLFWLDEADIHVWAEDHVEWDEVARAAREAGAEVVRSEDYLVCRAEYPPDLYEAYRERCSDMRLLVARKSSA